MARDLWQLEATDLARAIASGAVSAREATQACIGRMHAVNPTLNAVTVDLSGPALAAADQVDQAIARGEALGPLAGVPVTIKQNVDQAGSPTTNGVVAFKGVVADSDSPVVANWTAAGAIIIGRTNTPAFSARWETDNDLYGQTYNPFSRRHTPGGSSGGAAAAVAAGIGPLAHGNDLGGSVRYPAYACGLVGLRPSPGRVPAFNATAPAERPLSTQLMSVHGPLARRVRDVRLGLAGMAGADPRDPWWTPVPLEGPALPHPIRVAVVDDPAAFGAPAIHPAVRAAVRQAADWLADAGYAVEVVETPGFARAVEVWLALQVTELRSFLLPLVDAHGDEGVRASIQLFLGGRPGLDLDGYMQRLAERTRIARAWSVFLQRCPLVLSPVSFEPPFQLGFDTASEARTREVVAAQHPQLAVALLGVPAVSVPTGLADGLPMGVQIMGPRFREDLCLDAAEAIERRAPALTPVDPTP